MNISSAYIFGKQLKSITPPLQNDVIFDDGRFNANRMKQGFDFENNVAFIQDLYPGISFGDGQSAIANGAMYEVIQSDNGETLANHGTNNDVIYIEDGSITHVETSMLSSEAGVDYYFPVNMQPITTEGYETLNITYGYKKPSQESGVGNLLVYLYGINSNYSMAYIGGETIVLPNTYTEQENTTSIQLDGGLDKIPRYLRILMTSGTYHIKKIWFE